MSQNVFEIDAANLDGTGQIVPIDVNGGSPDDTAFQLDNHTKEEWEVKIYNDSDQDVDAVALASTSDDGAFAEYFEVEGATATVSSGGAVPGSVEYLDSDVVAGYIAVELTAAATPATGTVKVVFQSRKMGAN